MYIYIYLVIVLCMYVYIYIYIYMYMYESIPVCLVEIHIIGNPAPIIRAQVTPSQSFGPPTDSDVAAIIFLRSPIGWTADTPCTLW